MTDPKKTDATRPHETAQEAAPQAETAAPADGEIEEETLGGESAELPTREAELEAETAELKDKLLRTLAEMENTRRRAEREVTDARQYAIAGFARDMLVVTDNLRRALDAVGPQERENAEAAFATLVDGIEMTEREMLKALETHGVARLSPQGEKFDPNFHQAMFEVPDASVPNATVVQVVQDGYVIGGRILRPAMVGVSKGGPKAGPGDGEAKAASEEAPGGGVDKTA